MNIPLPRHLWKHGQRVKAVYHADNGDVEWTGVIVPMPDGHPLKDEMDCKEMVYIRDDRGQVSCWWDFMIEGGIGRSSPLYAA